IGVAPDRVALVGDTTGDPWVCRRPACLQEERGHHTVCAQDVEDSLCAGDPMMWPIRMLGVEGEVHGGRPYTSILERLTGGVLSCHC
ncbi:MAG: hypothetical protein QOF35_297, partial [Actinomycetota bacterium]|nr:hypothetical protein [Actinomycetota bacterium]